MERNFSRNITKDLFLAGLRCPKLAWNMSRGRVPQEAPTVAIEVGNKVHGIARSLFPDGAFASKLHYFLFCPDEWKVPIFEAPICGFLIPNEDWYLYCRSDILVFRDAAWEIHEVKSSTKLKQEHILDLAFQDLTFKKAGVPTRKCFLWHIDPQYVPDSGALTPSKLFIREDVTDQVEQAVKKIEKEVVQLTRVLDTDQEPTPPIGKYCLQHPRMDACVPCPLKERCWSFLPKKSVFNLIRLPKKAAFRLIKKGIYNLADVPDSALSKSKQLSRIQKIQIQCERSGEAHIERAAIKAFLDQLNPPFHFMDFETCRIVLPPPRWENCRPGTIIPFQYSLHVLESLQAEPAHYSFLADGKRDPRPILCESLFHQLHDQGSIIAYNSSFEISRLKECCKAFPQYKEWFETNILPRFVDLWTPFRKFAYYHPLQAGSTSIKAVLPVLTPYSYSGMPIHDGLQASEEFFKTHFLGHPNKSETRQALEMYCKLDTHALIHLLRALWRLAHGEEAPSTFEHKRNDL